MLRKKACGLQKTEYRGIHHSAHVLCGDKYLSFNLF